ncbi:MAG TPA: hypothetical protein P5121_15885 [Caldilineaceae bacterium]|nr:hypothetical protein [Caldilineaceae bacterium]
MRPNLVLPFHDPEGHLLRHLQQIAPVLKERFDRAFLSISPPTERYQQDRLRALRTGSFFQLNANPPGTQAGEHYLTAYQQAVAQSATEQTLHLCDIDKVAYALQSEHSAQFLDDIATVTRANTPLLFQRSAAAWATYPAIYRELEQMAIRIGELYFGRYFDFAWSYLIIEARQLAQLLPHIHCRDFGLLPELLLLLRDQLQTQEVDWLAWEDPFILQRDAAALRAERDSDPEETHKRLLWNKAVLAQVLAAIQ